MQGLREQAARSRAATPARWRRLASYLALAAASAASIATSPAYNPPAEQRSWQVEAAAAQSFGWDDPSSDLPPEAWSAQMQVTVHAPRGRWRVDLSAMQGEALNGFCSWTDNSDGSFSTEFQLAELSAEPWGDFGGRCVGLCLPARDETLELTCDAATCAGTFSLPVVAALLDATEVAPQVCVSAAVRGPAETKEAKAPSDVSIEVTLDSFVKHTVPVDLIDAGSEDAGETDAGAGDAGATDAMAEGAADAS